MSGEVMRNIDETARTTAICLQEITLVIEKPGEARSSPAMLSTSTDTIAHASDCMLPFLPFLQKGRSVDKRPVIAPWDQPRHLATCWELQRNRSTEH